MTEAARWFQLAFVVTVDSRGKACPLPIIDLAKAIRGQSGGQAVMLLATDPAVQADVRAFCDSTGHELLSIERSALADEWQVTLRVRARAGR